MMASVEIFYFDPFIGVSPLEEKTGLAEAENKKKRATFFLFSASANPTERYPNEQKLRFNIDTFPADATYGWGVWVRQHVHHVRPTTRQNMSNMPTKHVQHKHDGIRGNLRFRSLHWGVAPGEKNWIGRGRK